MPSWPAATSALREVSITNTVVASVTKTHSHHRWPAVLILDVFEHLPGRLIGMHMPSGPAVRGDRRRPRRDQRRDLLQRPAQGARGHLEPVGGQRLDDPVHRPAQHMLLIRQPRQEPGGEQALRHRPGRWRRADRRGPRMRTPPPAAAPPPHDPGDLHLPVDLLAVLGAQELKRLPALRTAPLAVLHIDDAFLSLQMRMIPPPMTRPARPLPPLTRAAWPGRLIPAVPP